MTVGLGKRDDFAGADGADEEAVAGGDTAEDGVVKGGLPADGAGGAVQGDDASLGVGVGMDEIAIAAAGDDGIAAERNGTGDRQGQRRAPGDARELFSILRRRRCAGRRRRSR